MEKKLFRFLLILSITIFVIIAFLCLTPPVSRDALTHHLYIPKLYSKKYLFFDLPHISFSYYPQLIDLLYCIPIYFGNDIIPKLIHFSFSLLTAFVIYFFLKRRINKYFAIIAALFFLTIPSIVKLSITVYVDLGLIFFIFVSIYYLFLWKSSDLLWKYLIYSGIFAGLALSVKYNAIICVAVIAVLIPFFLESGNNIKKVIIYPACFLLIATTIFSPWMIKNYVLKNNPVYPLYDNFFHHGISESNKKTPIDKEYYFGDRANHFVVRRDVYNENLFKILSIPVRIFFEGSDDNPKYFDGKLNCFLFFLPCFYIFIRKRLDNSLIKECDFLLYFSLLTILIVFFKSDMRIRYISPVIPCLVVVSFVCLFEFRKFFFERREQKLIKTVLFLSLVSLLFLENFLYIVKQYKIVSPYDYVSGKISRSHYIAKFRPEYKLIELINETSAENSKVLAMFLGRRGYFFDRNVRFRRDIFFYYIKKFNTGSDVNKELKKLGFNYIILKYDLFNGFSNRNLSDNDKKVLKDFFDYNVTFLKKNDLYGLYSLK